MRLDKLTIGSAKDSPTHQFKNLKNVTIDFDQDQWVTVVIGWNGTGKSNVLEALAIIFRDLIAQERKPAFAFQLAYRMGSGESLRHIYIDADPDRDKEPLTIHVATDAEARGEGTLISFMDGEPPVSVLRGKPVKLTTFLKSDSEYLPRYVFSYYSGEGSRMYDIFEPYLKDYYQKLVRSKTDPEPKRLFYALPVHSQFVLLAFLINPTDSTKDFFREELGIDLETGIESVLFELREPKWNSKEGDERFWFSRGLAQRFLDRLMNVSLAPITIMRKVPKSIWNKNSTKNEYKYLYIKDIESLRELVGNQQSKEFFRDLESTFVSDLIEAVHIRVQLKKNDGSVVFRELSEGEQQLLTVLGLLHFTAEDESLFLLDEPDTHLNPRWSVDYLHYLKFFIGQNSEDQGNGHIVLTTHNPLAIAELVKEQVQILYREAGSRTVKAENPAVDPKGMGFAGIVTSDMFGLGTSLDKATNEDLLALHQLSTQKTQLSDADRERLIEIRTRLEKLDFNFGSRDRLEQEYLRARFDLAANGDVDGAIITPENKQMALDALVQSLLRSLQEEQS
ncbi:AAA family ATPase [Microbulbifer sp. CAU 1566]|uniref:ATP-binding protein n=1 Tax=Microbulbifer sp. CAU 1566 TaxID=2933269 RepID=UPI0020030418|nr:ATP-binding protein [Microbulbifer sp. CAU 1566]MCK7596189.1 AAA family ATPase [Microbulbifer sp. CAU 1566]